MYGILCYDEKLSRWRTRTERLTLMGRPFLRLTVKGNGQLKRVERKFRKQGVRTVIPPEGGAGGTFGLDWVDVTPFLQAQAALLVKAGLQRLGRAPEESIVALRGKCVNAWLRRAAEELCPEVKGLILAVEKGGGELERDLYRRYGMGVLRERTGLIPDVAVCFSPMMEGAEARIVFSLYSGCVDLCGAEICVSGAPEIESCDRLSLLAALWDAGAVETGMTAVEWT